MNDQKVVHLQRGYKAASIKSAMENKFVRSNEVNDTGYGLFFNTISSPRHYMGGAELHAYQGWSEGEDLYIPTVIEMEITSDTFSLVKGKLYEAKYRTFTTTQNDVPLQVRGRHKVKFREIGSIDEITRGMDVTLQMQKLTESDLIILKTQVGFFDKEKKEFVYDSYENRLENLKREKEGAAKSSSEGE